MPLQVVCPNPECRAVSVIADDLLGSRARCKRCGRRFVLAPSKGETSAPPPPGASAPNTAIPERLGRFQIRERLGAGGFGTVYRAYDPTLDREVAVKVPHAGRLPSPQTAERFIREARAPAQLRHPHIVPVFEAGVDGDRLYIASALIEGHTLAEAIDAGPPHPREAARIAAELAEALDYAHARGVIHRDVKPANILLDAEGCTSLTDFGLARLDRPDPDILPEGSDPRLTRVGSRIGTPAYMAPEQAAGREAGPASDQYALGVVLYEMLAGRPPFDGPAEIVLYHAAHEPPPAPSGIRPGVPPPLEAICLRAMEKDPSHRYPRCQDLARELHAWLRLEALTISEGWPARPPGKKSARRRRPPAILAALALAASVAVGLAAWRHLGPSRPPFTGDGLVQAGEPLVPDLPTESPAGKAAGADAPPGENTAPLAAPPESSDGPVITIPDAGGAMEDLASQPEMTGPDPPVSTAPPDEPEGAPPNEGAGPIEKKAVRKYRRLNPPMPVQFQVVAVIDGGDSLRITADELEWHSSHYRPDLLLINGKPFPQQKHWTARNPFAAMFPPGAIDFRTARYVVYKKGANCLVNFRAGKDEVSLGLNHPPNGFGRFNVSVIYYATAVYLK
jgi:hypothetical protein